MWIYQHDTLIWSGDDDEDEPWPQICEGSTLLLVAHIYGKSPEEVADGLRQIRAIQEERDRRREATRPAYEERRRVKMAARQARKEEAKRATG